ncbi:MAG TPA: glycosyltransferase family 1 protein [Aliiroseovarius sp.]|nr:glycosyltransferase family 1 protein [Aliiroseovarius sp.]
MKIAFNGQRLAGQPFGVGRYLQYLLRYWGEMLTDDETVSLFLRQPLDPDVKKMLDPKIRPRLLRYNGSGIPWENMYLRRPARKHDVLFCPAYSAPVLYRGPLVVATHSVNETEKAAHTALYRQTYSRLYRHNARNADAVIVPCAMTGDAVADYYGVDRAKIHIVAQGADEAFRPLNDPETAARTRRAFFGENRPYILFVGSASPRRNTPMLIEAFADLRAQGFPHGLVLFGPYKGDVDIDALCKSLGVQDDVIQTRGEIEKHSDLVPIYDAADVFVHPSENEGWSMTTTEAMACGTAIIASNRGGLRDVVDGHGLMLDTPSRETLAEAMARVLSTPDLRRSLERRARTRGQQLTWHKTAQQTLDIIRRVGEGRI